MHGTAPNLIKAFDNALPEDERQALHQFLHAGGWTYGWRSRSKDKDTFPFWHRHFGGHRQGGDDSKAYECSKEIEAYPPIFALWRRLSSGILTGHRLIRCYANGHTYGTDGVVHTDSNVQTFTNLYYPHQEWKPDWAGETVFFNKDQTDIIGCVYPKPNRMLVFDGRIPHVARAVSRSCPVLRVTLMFKTDVPNAQGD